jgi:CO dehydrogenase maturation factor
MCRAHAAVRHLVGGMLQEENVVTIVDMEAGLEHLSRGTGRHVDTLVVMMEPYYRALETARRTAELGIELGIPRIAVVANKVRDDADRVVVTDFARSHGLEVVSEIAFDDTLRRGDQRGEAPIETEALAIGAIEELAKALVDGLGPAAER